MGIKEFRAYGIATDCTNHIQPALNFLFSSYLPPSLAAPFRLVQLQLTGYSQCFLHCLRPTLRGGLRSPVSHSSSNGISIG